MKTTVKLLIITAATMALAACGSTVDDTHPIGVGTGPNSLKLSPCAAATPLSPDHYA